MASLCEKLFFVGNLQETFLGLHEEKINLPI